MAKLDKISIRGFKSIEKLEDFELGNLNILIGANGAGKSNFVEFFRMLRAMVEQRFQLYVAKNGPADGYFFNGLSYTKNIEAVLSYNYENQPLAYQFNLVVSPDEKIVIEEERVHFPAANYTDSVAMGSYETGLIPEFDPLKLVKPFVGPHLYVYSLLSSLQVYHFHDTSMTAGMRRDVGVDQNEKLASDASNLAAFLLKLRDEHASHYDLLKKTLQRIAPYFGDFDLKVKKDSPEDTVRLRWRKKGSDYIFSPGHFSDGTIRFLCLATVLLQPNPPTTIVIDEPELGLHPEALSILGGLIRSASSRMQVIVATQSPVLLNEFEPNQIITVDQVDGKSQFNRLDEKALAEWLNDYSVGDLWQKGTIRGGVSNA